MGTFAAIYFMCAIETDGHTKILVCEFIFMVLGKVIYKRSAWSPTRLIHGQGNSFTTECKSWGKNFYNKNPTLLITFHRKNPFFRLHYVAITIFIENLIVFYPGCILFILDAYISLQINRFKRFNSKRKLVLIVKQE